MEFESDHRKLFLIIKRDSKDCDKPCPTKPCPKSDDDCDSDDKPPSPKNLESSMAARRSFLIAGSLLTSVFILCLLFMLFKRYLSRRNDANSARLIRNPQNPNPNPNPNAPILFDTTQEDFLEHGRVDHHIWFITTVGLPQSVIESISLFKYKPGQGLIEGTECSVCLSEFEEDEDVRLLPKCSHGFHVSCIDTWLRSHKNCPLCRAPIVRDEAVGESSGESNNASVDLDLNSQAVVEEGESSEVRAESSMIGSENRDMVMMRSSSMIGFSTKRSCSNGRRIFGSKHRRTQSSIVPL